MIIRLAYLAGILLIILSGCTSGSKIATVRQNADLAWERKDYGTALKAYEQIIDEYKQLQKTKECPVYGRAGLSAIETGDIKKAEEYLEMDTYTPYVTAETYEGQAKVYHQLDNLSKEIMALKSYLELFPEGENIEGMRLRLFKAYVESENWDLAAEIWPSLSETARTNTDVLADWFTVNIKLERDQECEALADELLQRNPEFIPALEWKAYGAFRFAENHYQTEMEAYEKNKTNKQYKKLLAELDKVTAEFQVALGYFDKLYKLDPNPKYANYISNIYVRFDDKGKADYYKKLGSQ